MTSDSPMLAMILNAEPAVEQIIISETSMSLADSTFTQDALAAQLRRLIAAVRGALIMFMRQGATHRGCAPVT
jgi:hypothetical protein